MQKKYSMMRLAANIFRVFGWVVLALGVIVSIMAGTVTGGAQGVVVAIAGIVYSAVVGIALVASADFFYCLMDIEENTRRRE